MMPHATEGIGALSNAAINHPSVCLSHAPGHKTVRFYAVLRMITTENQWETPYSKSNPPVIVAHEHRKTPKRP